MSFFRRSAPGPGEQWDGRLPARGSASPSVTNTSALGQSVVWAACRLRADLLSLMPVDVFRKSAAAGINVPVQTPNILTNPSQVADGQPMPIGEWLYSGQMSLDRAGNNFGVIRSIDALGYPARIDLVPTDSVTARVRGGQIVEYRINGEKHAPRHIWHERQFTVAGMPIGLSPIAYAALTIGGGISAQEFALDWFVGGAVPSAILKNTEKTVTVDQAETTKARFKASVHNGDVFVTGKDWTYDPVAANAAESSFIEQMQYSDLALARFFGAPADLLDIHVDSATINYANITQRNLQLLVMNLGAAIKRREDALTRLTAKPRFVKLNRDAILAMDAKTRAEVFAAQIQSRTRTPDQVRAVEDQQPLTEADYSQFDRLFGARTPNQPQTSGGN